jgi:hypothetical protein
VKGDKSTKSVHLFLSVALVFLFAAQPTFSQKTRHKEPPQWTDSFDIKKCQFSTTGENRYFILKPSYRLVFEGVEGGDTTMLVITVLNETKKIGAVETRVVEERESVNGNVVEISKNYYAFCTKTNTVFYFGEDVDIFKDEAVASHNGSWRPDSGGAKAGVMMPGIILLGSRYYQEIAPGVAMDRAEIVGISETVETPAGKFVNCLRTEETTPLEPKAKEYKLYAPGIGLVKDGDLLLTSYGSQ